MPLAATSHLGLSGTGGAVPRGSWTRGPTPARGSSRWSTPMPRRGRPPRSASGATVLRRRTYQGRACASSSCAPRAACPLRWPRPGTTSTLRGL
eukprot:1386641-Pyramimonas_sp.AAC.1